MLSDSPTSFSAALDAYLEREAEGSDLEVIVKCWLCSDTLPLEEACCMGTETEVVAVHEHCLMDHWKQLEEGELR